MKRNIVIGLFIVSITVFFYCLKEIRTFAEENKEVEPITNSLTNGNISQSNNEDQMPKILEIPEISIKASVVPVGVTKKGAMAAPKGLVDVGWYKYGPFPGERGSAVIAGHVDNSLALDGVFKHLSALKKGSDIYTVTNRGERMHFKVTQIVVYPYDSAPVEIIFNSADKSHLNLITCSGIWSKILKTYSERLVVYTDLVNIE